MKKLVCALVVVFFSFQVFAQSEEEEIAGGELMIRVVNNNFSYVEIELELISSLCWFADGDYPDQHDLTELFNESLRYTSDNEILDFYGVWASTPSAYDWTFGIGYYKVTAKVDHSVKDIFYIDYRTSDIPEAFDVYPSFCGPDITAIFSVSQGRFYRDVSLQTEFPTYTTIWEEHPCVEHITTELEPLPPDNFQLNTSGQNPQITWNHSSDTGDYWTNYAVYRSVVNGCNSPAGSFSKIATLSKYITSYTDYDLSIGGPMTAYYKIAAVNGARESEFTNTESVCVGLYKENLSKVNYTYQLNQNYPNPFNPVTEISFSLKDDSFVTLKVFDLLGREVAVLVNENLIQGIHRLQFDGSNLDSGIYFYEIFTKDFRDVKKFILLK